MDKKKAIIGILFILLIIRIVVIPLNDKISEKKSLIEEKQKTLLLKKNLVLRYKEEEKNHDSIENLKELVYAQEQNVTEIQAEMVDLVSETAGEGGLSVVNFSFIEGDSVGALRVPTVSMVLY
ncbi:MAG: hypothetical protein L3V56_00285 [Candidatus Magnetoovum sp. WYHC-5]|nr:hypothetical protein [Candidatus Magnetoovum sp. WYHC-5]